jgi:flagellar hook-length control protein FliK
VPGRKGVEVVPAAVQGVDPALVGGTVAPGAEDAGVAPAPATVATAEPVTDNEDVPVEGNAGAAAEDGEVPVDEVPVDEVAEAVTVAVAAVIAVPMAAATGTAVAEAPRQDAAAEVVRLAGAAPLMLLPVKDRKAEAVPPEKGLPTDAAEGEGDGEGVKFLKDDKDKGAETKVMARAAPVAPEVVAKPLPDRRAVPAAPVVEAVRGMDGAPAAAPQMQAAQPLMAQPLAPAPVAMDRPGWETALTEHIAAELSQDGQQIELDLSPERLGGLKITLEITDGQAQVRFVTETPEAARLIQQNEHRLSESLSRAGLSLGGHESASRDAKQQQGDRSGRGAPRGVDIAVQRPAKPRPGMISGRVGSGLVNLIA